MVRIIAQETSCADCYGARDSTSSALLEDVRPKYVVISAGEGNRFGHPHEDVLQRAADVGAAVL